MGNSFGELPHRWYYDRKLSEPDWPALMRPKTARAYLDGIVRAAKFDCLVAPNLDGRMIGGTLVYTHRSIDDWIERGDGTVGPQTPEELARLLDDDDQSSQSQKLRK
jgi:hypothetical protein